MEANLKEIVLNNSNEIVKMWLEEIERNRKNDYTSTISDELFESTNREFVNVIFLSLEKEGLTNDIEGFAERLINLGWPLSYLTDGMQAFRRVTINYILSQSNKVDTKSGPPRTISTSDSCHGKHHGDAAHRNH